MRRIFAPALLVLILALSACGPSIHAGTVTQKTHEDSFGYMTMHCVTYTAKG